MQDVQFNIRSYDWDSALKAADKARQFMKSRPQFTDVDLSYRTGKPQIDVANGP